ncbi:MAG TPA: hypothetical protein VHC90_11090 [Bryobacteraceae bacterium]|nr:hypothetical protein [Bryobacteraceae bacterium]
MSRIFRPIADNDYITVSSTPKTTASLIALPHLILHPFGAASATDQLLEGSRAAMDLQEAALSNPRYSEIQERVLLGRYQEIRMLLFLGKDVFRWIDQCLDQLKRSGDIGVKTNAQFFSALIVDSPPEPVKKKLEEWGVSDRRAVFSRAIGIRCLFEEPPDIGMLSPMFLENYHRFADYAYVCFQQMKPYQPVDGPVFDFRIFASEEYSRILADQWQEQES